eukprot:1603326-Rhodomonas_salina.1
MLAWYLAGYLEVPHIARNGPLRGISGGKDPDPLNLLRDPPSEVCDPDVAPEKLDVLHPAGQR